MSKSPKPLTIAPSGLHWEYERCPRCYWNQVHRVWKKPYTPFPSVFSRIDKAMRKNFDAAKTDSFAEMVPGGRIDTKEVRLKSAPFDLGGKLFQYSGRTDAIARFDDKSWAIYDFKTSSIDTEKLIEQYRPQLMCMAASLKHSESAKLHGTEVKELGLICFEPTLFCQQDERSASLEGDIAFVRVPLDWSWWADYERKLHELLAGPCPEPTGDCQWCEIQQAMEAWADFKEAAKTC